MLTCLFMKKYIVILFILLIPLAFAGNIEYTIIEKKSLVDISYSEDEYSNIDFPIEKTILDFDSKSNIKYLTNSFVEKYGNDYFFISTNEFHKYSEVTVNLPSGAILDSRYFVFPKDYKISTNGQNIIISWNNSLEKDILIPYTIPFKFNIWPIILSFIIVFLVFYIIIKNYKKKKNDYTKNLFSDEKKIVKYLLNKKECWTKELVRDLNISKVKLSRKLRSLEEKGLITRTPHGNENRIILKE